MPHPTDYRGTTNAVPVRLVPPGAPHGFVTKAGVKKVCTPSVVLTQSWVDPSTIDTNGIVESHAGAGSAGTTSMTLDGDLVTSGVATLTPARNVVITVTHGSSVVAMSGVITGTRMGKTITEAWSVSATGTTKTFTGAVAFDTVTSITEVVAADASANTIIVGDGKKLGLDFKCSSVFVIAEEQDAAVPTLGVLVKGSTSANADERGTYTPNGTLNGALDFQVWYLSDDVTLAQ